VPYLGGGLFNCGSVLSDEIDAERVVENSAWDLAMAQGGIRLLGSVRSNGSDRGCSCSG